MHSNPWIRNDERELFVRDIFVTGDMSKWRHHDIILSTTKSDHLVEYRTLIKIFELMPENVHWDHKFALGVQIPNAHHWKKYVKEYLLEQTKLGGNGNVCFLNFEKHKLNADEKQIYLQNESEKIQKVNFILQNAELKLKNKETQIVIYTSSDPTRSVIIGSPPEKCDILMTRSEFVDAIPESCLKKFVSENGVVIHFGRLKSIRNSVSPIYVDSMVFENLDTYSNWTQCFPKYISKLIEV